MDNIRKTILSPITGCFHTPNDEKMPLKIYMLDVVPRRHGHVNLSFYVVDLLSFRFSSLVARKKMFQSRTEY